MFELVIEIVRRKLERYLVNKYEKIVCTVESSPSPPHHNRYYSLSSGTRISVSVPLEGDRGDRGERKKEIQLNIFAIDGSLTIFVGSCVIDPLASSPGPEEIKMCQIFDSNENRVGKLYFTTFILKLYDDGQKESTKRTNIRDQTPKFSEGNKRGNLSDFRFQHLGRQVNWDRIRSLNLERVSKTKDIPLLMTCLEDAAAGDVSQEDIDPRFHQTFQLAQYSVQYLLSCQQLLNQRTEMIQNAMQTFDEEEIELDFQIAKLRARNKALEREDDDLNVMKSQYLDLLESINPTAAKKYKMRERAANSALEYEKLKNTEEYAEMMWKKKQKMASEQYTEKNRRKTRPKRSKEEKERPKKYLDQETDDLQRDDSESNVSEQFPQKGFEKRTKGDKKEQIPTSNPVDSVIRNISKSSQIQVTSSLPQKKVIESKPNPPAPKLELLRSEHMKVPPKSQEIQPNASDQNISESISTDEENIVQEKKEVHSHSDESVSEELENLPLLATTWPQKKTNSPDSLPQSHSEPSLPLHNTNHISNSDGIDPIKSLTFDTGLMSVDSLLLEPNGVSKKVSTSLYETKNTSGILSTYKGGTKSLTNLSVEEHEDVFERNQSDFDATTTGKHDFSETQKSEDFQDSVSQIDIYLPLQDRDELKTTTEPSMNSTTGKGLQSEVIKFIHEEELHNQVDSPNIQQTYRSKNYENDDVLLGTNRLQVTYGDTISSFETNTSSFTPNRETHSPQLQKDHSENEILLLNPETNSESQPESTDLKWLSGRAPLDFIETAIAFDIFVSAVRFHSPVYSSTKIRIQFEFMELLSSLSDPIQTNLRMSVLPVSYGAYQVYNRESSLLLAEEISNRQENLCIIIRILEEPATRPTNLKDLREIGDAVVELWVMIEDSCSIVRQEIDICELETGQCIGSAVVDVRGHHLFSRCS